MSLGVLKFLNPTVVLAIVAAVGVSSGLGYWRGVSVTENSIAADIAREEQLAQRIFDEAIAATASEISKIEILNTTIKQKVEREIRTEKIYLECRHTGDTFRLLNAILEGTGSTESFSDFELPVVDAPD